MMTHELGTGTIMVGDAVDFLRSLPDACLDAVVTDPPYAEVDRPYGRLSEVEWWALVVEGVIPEVRRVLKPTGSAVFIVQPNSRKVGSMRGWVFRFMYWVTQEWNLIQDAWWWNTTPLPCGGANTDGLLKASLKPCVWAGSDSCFRDQDAVLCDESQRNASRRAAGRFRVYGSRDSYHGKNERSLSMAAETRGGVTPQNVLPIPNASSALSASAYGHQAGTPLPLMRWWTRYIVPPGGVVCDPFMGSGTGALAAIAENRQWCGSERDEGYVKSARERVAEALRAKQDRLPFGGDEKLMGEYEGATKNGQQVLLA